MAKGNTFLHLQFFHLNPASGERDHIFTFLPPVTYNYLLPLPEAIGVLPPVIYNYLLPQPEAIGVLLLVQSEPTEISVRYRNLGKSNFNFSGFLPRTR